MTFVGPAASAFASWATRRRRAGSHSIGGSDRGGNAASGRVGRRGAGDAADIGYPVIVKAAAGGGGRGMRVTEKRSGTAENVDAASTRGRGVVRRGALYSSATFRRAAMSRCRSWATGGTSSTSASGSARCSAAARKYSRKAPVAGITEDLRGSHDGCGRARLAASVATRSAGTLEFIFDAGAPGVLLHRDEHQDPGRAPGHRADDGLDLVREQLLDRRRRAARLRAVRHHFAGSRSSAESTPRTGPADSCPPRVRSRRSSFPEGRVRVDTALFQGDRIPPYYDSLIAKLIVWAPTREEAISRGRRALREFTVEGVKTTIPFHIRLLMLPRSRPVTTASNFSSNDRPASRGRAESFV